jgi:large repetitive protein
VSRSSNLFHAVSRNPARALLWALVMWCPLVGFCGSPHQVLNINTTLVPQSSYPQYLGVLGGKMLLGARDGTGPGLWSTDGTAQGTVLIRRLTVTAQTSFPGTPNFVVFGDRGYFVGDDGSSGAQPWSTDGTAAGTVRLGALATGSNPQFLGVVGAQLVFSAADGSSVRQMYVSDGTASGTLPLTQFTGANFGVTTDFTLSDNLFLPVSNRFYFVQVDSSYQRHIWVSDGTVAGTHAVTDPSGANALYNPHGFALVGTLVLYASQGLLWSIDTTTDTIGAVTATGGTAGFGPPQVDEILNPVAMNGFVLFLANGTAFASVDLWRSDGTPSGTYKVAAVHTGPLPSIAQQVLLQRVGDRALFIGQDAQNSYQLWSTDGTVANTTRLTTVSEPANVVFSIAIYAASLGGTAYVSLPDGAQTTTWSVWRTDGTQAGTHRVTGLPSIDQSEAGLTAITGDGTRTFVEIYTPAGATQLFKYDPVADTSTPLSTTLQTNVLDGFFYTAGALYFSSNDPVVGDEPWISDGTAAGTHLIADLNPQSTDNGSNPDEFVAFGGALTFAADDGVHGRELWRSDGTAGGTTLLADINPGAAGSNPSHLFVADGALYFFATDGSGTQKFMRLAATAGATPQVLGNLTPPVTPQGFAFPLCQQPVPVALNGSVYFSASDGVSGQEIWSTDGTAAGTHLVADINAGAADSNPCNLTVFGNRVYFAATGINGTEVWSSDGSAAGTVEVADIAPGTASSNPSNLVVFKGRLYFEANDGVTGNQVWSTDGTAAGTQLLASIVPNSGGSVATPDGVVSNTLLIGALVASNQTTAPPEGQFWTSDGTSANTARLGTVAVGLGPAFLDNGVTAYFTAPGTVGPEPWVTDGTVAGTHLLTDINPTATTSIAWFENFNGAALFAVADPSFGEQLWRSDGTSPGTVLVGTIPAETSYSQLTSFPLHRLTVGQTFFFVGDDSRTGNELYALINTPPVAAPDTANSSNDQAVTINVLGNDSDPDGAIDPSSVLVTSGPSHGTAVVNANGTIVYTPTSAFSGTDSFAYTVNDTQGATSAPANVTVTVTAQASSGVTVSGSKGGGGALDIFSVVGLLVLAAARIGRRRKCQHGCVKP